MDGKRNGWTRRANEFKRAIAKEIGVKYEPITPYNETREYQKTVVDGKDVFTLVEKRGDEFVPVGRTDWVDSYQLYRKKQSKITASFKFLSLRNIKTFCYAKPSRESEVFCTGIRSSFKGKIP